MSPTHFVMAGPCPRACPGDLPALRRETLTNRDLGTAEATAGRMLALVTSATQGLGSASGWHYHVREHQLIYVLKGWVDLEAEDGTHTRTEAGDSVIIPGGMRHTYPVRRMRLRC
jgi:quercetin dioxygenase-like cupin family protein